MLGWLQTILLGLMKSVFGISPGPIFTSAPTLSNVNVVLGTATGTQFGTATGQKLAFHGSTPTVQRVGDAQVAVTLEGASLDAYGFSEIQANAIVTLVNELRAAMIEKGMIKGSA